jgi:hypothetical protein
MKKIIGVFALLTLVGCVGRGPLHGGWYQDTTYPIAETSNQAGNRVGEACGSQILGLIATGDASVEAARRNGGITMVSSVDEATTNILGIYGKACTVVRGR